jgi:hypothetical protein
MVIIRNEEGCIEGKQWCVFDLPQDVKPGFQAHGVKNTSVEPKDGFSGARTNRVTENPIVGRTAATKTDKKLKSAKALSGPPEAVRAALKFEEEWAQAFKVAFGRFYVLQKGRDRGAVNQLLKIPGTPDLIGIARKAWDHPDKFHCKAAATISGFYSRFNDIQLELSQIKVNGKKPNSTSPANANLNAKAASRY